MKIVSSLSAAADALAGRQCVLSIGNFDGLHLGHQAILQTVVRKARELSLPAVAMTFEPHPIQVLYPEKAPRRISTPERKVEQIEKCGIDVLFTIPFDHDFARISADDFVRRYLIEGLRVRAICVGSNFNFGHRQEGTVKTLRQWAGDFELVEVPAVAFRNLSASSTQVRKNVMSGEVSKAARLLGRWYEIEGQIVSGAGRGRKVTVPTLNLDPANKLLPAFGVYVTRISLDGGPYLDAVSNIGVRPTFGENTPTIETFVLRDPVPPAGAARLQFLHRIREEKRFDSSELLARQIGLDVQAALKFFRRLTHLEEHARTHSH
jgi:riboflavin kinase / FMN adenylyltransferase